jgi:tRNA(Ile)-lysidine synthase
MIALAAEMQQRLQRVIDGRIVVAFSGGVDSHVLLHLMAGLQLNTELWALHINHHIHADCDQWQHHCESVCLDLGVAFASADVSVSRTGSVEENARNARYEAFEAFLGEHDLLLLAHHADDQAETILMTLLRGDRLALAGMPSERPVGRAALLRPLLAWRRQQILEYAASKGLHWIEDDSNHDPGFTRNYLRYEVMPLLTHRWPRTVEHLNTAHQRDREYSLLLRDLGESDLHACAADSSAIDLKLFIGLSPLRRKNLLRTWASLHGLPQPSEAMLDAELDRFVTARVDAAPLLNWQGVCFRRFDGRLFLTPDVQAEHDLTPRQWDPDIRTAWSGGTVAAVRGESMGLALAPGQFEIRCRKAGESILLDHHRKLKKVLQDQKVPTWLRDLIPLICVDGELAAIAGLPAFGVPMLVSPPFRSTPGLEVSFQLPNQPYSH